MAFLYNESEERERKSILIATTGSRFFLEPLWRMMHVDPPHWIGINIPFQNLLGDRRRELGVDGDVDILAIPARDAKPDFSRMLSVEVKTIPFSLGNDLFARKKLDEADVQAGKLRQIGFESVAILHILVTENTPNRDPGGSGGWFGFSDDRGLEAYDAIRLWVKGRTFPFPTFTWPWSSHPTLGEDQAGGGTIHRLGGPQEAAGTDSTTPAPLTTFLIENMIAGLPQPVPPNPFGLNNVFSLCQACAKTRQHFRDSTFCGCGCNPTLVKAGSEGA